MPRNRSEKGPTVYPLTSRPRLNRYIAFWYALHWGFRLPASHKRSPDQHKQANLLDRETDNARDALDELDRKAWSELHPFGQTYVSGHVLRDLYRAAQSK